MWIWNLKGASEHFWTKAQEKLDIRRPGRTCQRLRYANWPCCALIFLRTYPAVTLFFLRTYAAAVYLFFFDLPCCALIPLFDYQLPCCDLIFLRTYPAVPISRFTITTYPAATCKTFSAAPTWCMLNSPTVQKGNGCFRISAIWEAHGSRHTVIQSSFGWYVTKRWR